MKKITFNLCAVIALTALAATTAKAQWTYAGGNLNAAQTYDGLGTDSGLDPRSQGTTNDVDYVGTGGTGSITVQSGSLTLTANDFKIARNANSTGTVSVVSGTLTINQLNQWGGGIGANNNNNNVSVGTANIAAGATLNWFLSGSSEQSFRVGNGGGGANGFNTLGTINMNGGTFNVELDATEAQTDASRAVTIGQANGTGILNLNSGTFNVIGDWPVAVGGAWGTMTTSPAFASSGTGRINIQNGAFVMSNATVVIDATKASFTVGTSGYVNFVPGGTGYLSLTNWSAGDYQTLVDAGQIRVGSNTTTIANFQYSNVGGQGILKLADPTVLTPSISPSNVAYAGEIRILTTAVSGTAPFTYQWQRNDNFAGFVDIVGAHSQTYTQDTTGLLGNYDYQVIVTNGVSNVNTSGVATLTVNAGQSPVILTDTTPSPVSRYVGGTVAFSATFYGNQPMTYQWQADTGTGYTNIPGATTTTLTLTNLQYVQAGSYRLAATNSVGDNASTPATLTILNPAGLQFTWSAPVSITNLTADQILPYNLGGALGVVGAAVFGNTAPIIVNLAGGRSITFKNDGSIATSTGSGPAVGAYPAATALTTSNTNFDNVLNQFRYDDGSHTITLNNLTPGETYSVQLFALDNRTFGTNRLSYFQDGDDAAISVETSATNAMGDNAYVLGTFTASNTTETIVQQLPTGGSGNINALVLRAKSFTPAYAPIVLTQPASKTVFAGRSVQFSVVVDSYVTPTYQWQTNNVDVGNGGVFSGATSSVFNIANVTGMDGYQISCIISNPAGSTPSSAASLTVLAIPPTSGAVAANVLAQSPIAYWPLNETFDPYGDGTGNMPVYDRAGTADGHYRPYAGNAFNSITGPQAADGFSQFAASQGAVDVVNNLDSWVTVPGVNLNTNTVTISMWVNPDVIQAAFTGLLMNRNAGQGGGLHFRSGNELGYTWVLDNTTQWGHATGLIVPTNQWSFVALVITPTNTSWYLYNTNGVQTHSYTPPTNNPVMPWTGSESAIAIGKDTAIATRVFDGRIDEVAMFNRALNLNEVMSLVTSNPVFATQPQSQSLPAGFPAQFSASVASLTTVTYQWKTNGVNVGNGGVFSGATSNVLSIANITGLNGVVFSLAVTNAAGNALSASATLTIPTPANTYWDIDGATADAGGVAPGGTWSTTATNWTTDSTGSSAGAVWSNGNNAVFSAGTIAANQFNVTNLAVTVNDITQEEGKIRVLTTTSSAISLFDNSTTITLNKRNTGDYDLRIDPVITDAGGGTVPTAIVKEGPGVLLFEANPNTFSGGLTLNAGTISIESNGSGVGKGTLTLNGGNFTKSWGANASTAASVTNRINVTGSVNVGIVQGNAGSLVFSGPWDAGSSSGNFNVTNIALNGLSIQSTTLNVSGDVSAYTGTFTHNCLASGGNRLRFGAGTGVSTGFNAANAKFVTLGSTSGANCLDLADNDYGTFKMGELSGTGGNIKAGWSTNGGTTFEIGSLNTSTVYSGLIKDNLRFIVGVVTNGRAGLTKVGTGTLELAAASTYTGLTTVSNGILRINSPFLSSATNVVIAASGKLDLNFIGTNNVKQLIVAGVTVFNGTYGATGSGAANIDNTHFAGTGVLKVTGSSPVVPASLSSTVTGSTLALSWPGDQGWTLQMQTNSLTKGLGTNWTTLVSSGSGITSTNITLDPSKPTVFYRLVYP